MILSAEDNMKEISNTKKPKISPRVCLYSDWIGLDVWIFIWPEISTQNSLSSRKQLEYIFSSKLKWFGGLASSLSLSGIKRTYGIFLVSLFSGSSVIYKFVFYQWNVYWIFTSRALIPGAAQNKGWLGTANENSTLNCHCYKNMFCDNTLYSWKRDFSKRHSQQLPRWWKLAEKSCSE